MPLSGSPRDIRGAGDKIEMGRRISRLIAAAMKEVGVFGMVMPRSWGGPELDPLTQIRIIEALANGRRFGRVVRDDRLRQRLHDRLPRSRCRP
jgi:alkylation response protein AidB-like acyl-CoA dehydrogenase